MLFGCFNKKEFVEALPTISTFTPEKYTGKWYEIARFPHSFERGLVRVTAEYVLHADGKIDVVNTGYDEELLGKGKSDEDARSVARGKARLVKGTRLGRLEVSFFGPFYGDYIIIALDEKDYTYAMIASSSNDYLWILSRTPIMDEKIYTELVSRAAKSGYDISRLIKVRQK